MPRAPADPECPDCGLPMSLMGSRWGLGWHCPDASCGGRHGAHPDGRPLGIPADAGTRRARAEAHDAFDRLWQHGAMTRSQAYSWLARTLGVGKDEAHIGMLGRDECLAVGEAVRRDFPDMFPLSQ